MHFFFRICKNDDDEINLRTSFRQFHSRNVLFVFSETLSSLLTFLTETQIHAIVLEIHQTFFLIDVENLTCKCELNKHIVIEIKCLWVIQIRHTFCIFLRTMFF
jgi:hypothetical protein